MSASRLVLPLVLAGLLAAPGIAAAQEPILADPVDEAAQDPVFAAYREALLEAIVRRDVDAVIAAAAPGIILSFGGDEGRDSLRARLTLQGDDLAPEYYFEAATLREGYWDELEEVLRFGGRFTEPGRFEAPYTWTAPFPSDGDPYTTGYITGTGVVLRDRPSRFGAAAGSLRYDIVTILEGGDGTMYSEIETQTGLRGYVHRDYLRSAVDYRAIFERGPDGVWLMSVFIAGD